MPKSEYCIGVDLGGANIAIGLVRIGEKCIAHYISIKTNAPRPCEEISRDILDVCLRLCRQEGITLDDVKWIGIAAPGIICDDVVVEAVNLSWKNVEIGKILAEISGKEVYVANDANAAAYAEALWGSGEGARSLVAFTLGTGVGGGIVIDGKIWCGINGFAAEMGHTVVVPDGRACSCGKRGCLEAYCSAPAIVREAKRMMKLYPGSVMWKLTEGSVDRVNGKTAFLAAKEGDRAAKAVLDDFIDKLSIAVSNTINTFQPDVVCIGGGISREGDTIMIPLCEKVSRLVFGLEGHKTKLVAASFKNDAGIIGAALLGFQNKQ